MVSLNDVPIVDFNIADVLLHVDWYDGPLTGMIQHKEKQYWFDCVDEHYTENKRIRTFNLYEPTEQQLKERTYWDTEFKKHVRDGLINKPRSEWDKFIYHMEKLRIP